jgi:hypothetical protein
LKAWHAGNASICQAPFRYLQPVGSERDVGQRQRSQEKSNVDQPSEEKHNVDQQSEEKHNVRQPPKKKCTSGKPSPPKMSTLSSRRQTSRTFASDPRPTGYTILGVWQERPQASREGSLQVQEASILSAAPRLISVHSMSAAHCAIDEYKASPCIVEGAVLHRCDCFILPKYRIELDNRMSIFRNSFLVDQRNTRPRRTRCVEHHEIECLQRRITSTAPFDTCSLDTPAVCPPSSTHLNTQVSTYLAGPVDVDRRAFDLVIIIIWYRVNAHGALRAVFLISGLVSIAFACNECVAAKTCFDVRLRRLV